MAPSELRAQLAQLVASQLVDQLSPEAYAFRHTLTREAAYATLLRRERRLCHQAVAATLEALYAGALDEHAADLAYHYAQAEAWGQALRYARHAGDRARAQFAPREAVQHYTLALRAAERQGLPPDLELLRGRGLAHEIVGDFDAAQADFEAGRQAAAARGDPPGEWQALLDLGQLWAGRDYGQTRLCFERALELARATGDHGRLAQSLNRMGNWHLNNGQLRQAWRYHEQALAMFQALDDPAGLAQTYDLLGLTAASLGEIVAADHYYQEALRLFHQLGDRRGEAASLMGLAETRPNVLTEYNVPVGTVQDGIAYAQQSLALARQIGWRAGEAYALLGLGVLWTSAGDFGQGLAALEAAIRLAREIEHHQWLANGLSQLSIAYLELWALRPAHAAVDEALRLARSVQSQVFITVSLIVRAALHAQLGEHAAAEADLAALKAREGAETVFERIARGTEAELALQWGQPARTLAIVEAMTADANLAPDAVIPRLWRLKAEALTALGHAAEAVPLLDAAQQAARARGTRTELWRLHAALARVWRAQGRPDEAARERAAALAIIDALAQTVPDPGLRAGFVAGASRAVDA